MYVSAIKGVNRSVFDADDCEVRVENGRRDRKAQKTEAIVPTVERSHTAARITANGWFRQKKLTRIVGH